MRSTYHRTRARPGRLRARIHAASRVRAGACAGRANVALIVALTALGSPLLAGAPPAAGAAAAPTLVIAGAGFGHGVGMSQDGALGYAEHGYDYRAILAHYYTGTAIGQAPPAQRVRVLLHGKVKQIALETYVRGVVSAEMPANWPAAALQAQAVASRTYALTAHASARFDVYADTRSQVYRGRAAETPATNAAVAATAGQIVTYAGRPAITYFFASSGGKTENVQDAFPGSAPEPWLQAVADPYDTGAQHRWSLSMSFAAARAHLTGLVRGSFRGIEVLRRGSSPRILSANVIGSRGRTAVSGPALAARLGLYDSWAYFSVATTEGVHAEPDRSGSAPPAAVAPEAPAPAPPIAPAPVPTSAGGTGAGQGANPDGGTVAG